MEYLIRDEGQALVSMCDVEKDLLSIPSVYSMRHKVVRKFLVRAGGEWARIHRLTTAGQPIKAEPEGHKFLLRDIRRGSQGEGSWPRPGPR
jgi:hypothetical protein